MDAAFGSVKPVHINAVPDEFNASIILEVGPHANRVAVNAVSKLSINGTYSMCMAENKMIDLLHKAKEDPMHDSYNAWVSEAVHIILLAGGRAFLDTAGAEIPQPPLPLGQFNDLQTILYPDPIHYRLETVDGRPKLSPAHAEVAIHIPNGSEDPDWWQPDDDVPSFNARDLFQNNLACKGGRVMGTVMVDGRVLWCKATRAGISDPGFLRELTALQDIRRATNSGKAFFAPRLEG